VPGRKSDVNDATWISDLLAHGLIRNSFVPPARIMELRELTRTRKQLGREIVQHTQRIQAVLQEANVKLDSAISNILGMSGRKMLRAMIGGEQDPKVLAALGSPRLECGTERLVEALRGRVTAHHRFLLKQHLDLIEELERRIGEFDGEIARVLEPFRELIERLKEIPGIGQIAAQSIVAEIGVQMQCFPTAGHLVSWACLCPGQDESAGKHRSNRARRGAAWLKPLMVQCAWAAVRSKNTYLNALYIRLKGHRGPKKAIVGVAASMLTAIYYMVLRGTPYQELGGQYFAKRDAEWTARRLAKRIERLGYEVKITKAA
jgi:transposase